MARNTFSVTITGEQGVIFFDECEAVLIPSLKGDVAILKSHTPMIARLPAGNISVRQGGKIAKICEIKSGLAHIEEDEAVVMVATSSEPAAS